MYARTHNCNQIRLIIHVLVQHNEINLEIEILFGYQIPSLLQFSVILAFLFMPLRVFPFFFLAFSPSLPNSHSLLSPSLSLDIKHLCFLSVVCI